MIPTFPDLQPHEAVQLFPWRPVLAAYIGSVAHGTGMTEQPDDIDIMSVFIPEAKYYLGYLQKPPAGKHTWVKQYDSAAYEFRHFCHLLAGANPNIVSFLWCDSYLIKQREGEILLANRDLFLSKRAFKTFGGYALSQLKRMTAWKDQGPLDCGCGGEFHEAQCKVALEKGRGSSKLYATGFMGAKRKALAEKYGYDTKNAAHLIRILKMGIELLLYGKVWVNRSDVDADELRAIKSGAYTLLQVQAMAKGLFADLEVAKSRSRLPDGPPMDRIARLVTDAMCISVSSEVVMRSNDALLRATDGTHGGPDWSLLTKRPAGLLPVREVVVQ